MIKMDIIDWCMVALITTLLTTATWYAHIYEIPQLLSGVGIGVAIGALTMGLGSNVRERTQRR